MKRHIVKLTKRVQSDLQELVRAGTRPVRVVRRANILLKSNEGLTDEQIAEHVGCTARCVAAIRKRFCQEGLERALFDAPRSGGPPKFTRKQQQQVLALACTDPPEGRRRWTLELLCERAAAEGFVPSVSTSEVSLWLRENELKPWRKKKRWCVPKLTREFRERMEDVLDLYERPYDPQEPVVGLDEKPYQLLDEVWPPQPSRPGRVARQDYEYSRKGTCCVFVAVEPKAGRRHTWVRRQRTKADFAYCVKELVKCYPKARRIHLIVDNLNTHTLEAIEESLGPKWAQRVRDRVRFHYTPKHASWLNVAEIEISVLSQQCLDRRLPTLERVQQEVAAWQRRRNRQGIGIRWDFGRNDARRVFPQLYKNKLVA